MNILLLSPYTFGLKRFLEKTSHYVIKETNEISLTYLKKNKIDFIISHGYRYIITEDIINKYKDKCINLHISYLPYGKGSHPIIHALKDKEPLGITIHKIDKGLDTGDLLFNHQFNLKTLSYFNLTLNETWEYFNIAIIELFKENYSKILNNKVNGCSQALWDPKKSSFHYSKEIDFILNKLPKKWDTKLNEFISIFN